MTQPALPRPAPPPQAMQTRAALQKQAQAWLDAAGELPPGNGAEAEAWGGAAGSDAGSEASVDVGAMSPAELAEYEERKLKLRKAMGEGRGAEAGPGAAAPDAAERRQNMINAVEVRRGALAAEGGSAGRRHDRAPAAPLAAGLALLGLSLHITACADRPCPAGRRLVGGDRRADARDAAGRRRCRGGEP
jgi:hypothetical protein